MESRTGRNVLIAVVVVILLIVILFATGILGADTEGQLEAPEVSVQGGEMPDVDVDAADVDVGTTNVTTEVPTVDVEPAE